METAPSTNILYINNIKSKLKITVIKEKLKMIFSQYGPVEQIYASRKLAAKGQVLHRTQQFSAIYFIRSVGMGYL